MKASTDCEPGPLGSPRSGRRNPLAVTCVVSRRRPRIGQRRPPRDIQLRAPRRPTNALGTAGMADDKRAANGSTMRLALADHPPSQLIVRVVGKFQAH
jgi:hypothetical protein